MCRQRERAIGWRAKTMRKEPTNARNAHSSENHANQDLMAGQVDPSHILQVGMGFWGSKALLSAVELELFTRLGSESMTGPQIAEALGLDARAIPDFPDALVALELLD